MDRDPAGSLSVAGGPERCRLSPPVPPSWSPAAARPPRPGPPLGACLPGLLELPLHGGGGSLPQAGCSMSPAQRAWGLGPPLGHRVRGKEPGVAWREGWQGAPSSGVLGLRSWAALWVEEGGPRPPGGQEVPATSPGRLQPQPWGSSHASPLTSLIQVPGKGLDPRFQAWTTSPHQGPQTRPLCPASSLFPASGGLIQESCPRSGGWTRETALGVAGGRGGCLLIRQLQPQPSPGRLSHRVAVPRLGAATPAPSALPPPPDSAPHASSQPSPTPIVGPWAKLWVKSAWARIHACAQAHTLARTHMHTGQAPWHLCWPASRG